MYNNLIWITTETKTVYFKKFLSIGGVFFTDKPTHIWTILGPCVSVILHSPERKISAMCHAQLVEKEFLSKQYFGLGSNQYTTTTKNIDFRYVVCSVNYMIEQFIMMGIQKNKIQASIYGGAHLISDLVHNIGSENVNIACEFLKNQGVSIIKKDVGGEKSRVIRHYSDTGITHVKVF
jgi:chemotaxis protein CheD